MMSSLYKRMITSRRWYLYIVYHTLTITAVNCWIVYRRCCEEQREKGMGMSMSIFHAILGESLAKHKKLVGRLKKIHQLMMLDIL